ncbi:flagellar FlbD family protein [Lysobacter korlensis]|uniref:Flagellar FlbD family protein n=1 Tax=Lysobacter korlensis TaxID=553636 RepID=A0ABV6RXU8_9GAMM
MIVVTRLNHSRFAVNPDLIERIQASPDTTLVLADGTTYVVTETLEQVIDLVTDFRARVIARARTAVDTIQPDSVVTQLPTRRGSR